MTVSFYDPTNMRQYDEDYNVIGGGPEANFSNHNARTILDRLGLDGPLYGELKAEQMLDACVRAAYAVERFEDDPWEKTYLLNSIEKIRDVALEAVDHGGVVVWS